MDAAYSGSRGFCPGSFMSDATNEVWSITSRAQVLVEHVTIEEKKGTEDLTSPRSAHGFCVEALLEKIEAGFGTVGGLYNACKFRAALGEALALAREANGYLDRKAPWFQIKEDRDAAATTVYVILRVVDNLKTILAPILPRTAQQLHEYLGYEGQLFGIQQVVEYQEETRAHQALTYDHSGAIGTWTPSQLPPGQALRPPAPLFKKLD